MSDPAARRRSRSEISSGESQPPHADRVDASTATPVSQIKVDDRNAWGCCGGCVECECHAPHGSVVWLARAWPLRLVRRLCVLALLLTRWFVCASRLCHRRMCVRACVRVACTADASSDEDDFYDAAEYDAPAAASPAAAAAATVPPSNGASAANTGTSAVDTVSSAVTALSHMQVQGDGATSAAAAAAASPQPPPSSSRPQSTSVEARVAPIAVSSNATNPVSVDTATPLGATGSPVTLPQSLASAPNATMAVPPARPPRPSYSLPGSATTTPQSTLKGPLNLSQLAAGMVPPIPARSSPIVSAGTMTHSAAGSSATSSVSSSLTSSPIPTQRPQPVQARPYAHSQPTSPPGASPSSAATAAAAAGLPFTIKNLDTGETCDLAEATSVFPEVERAMTLKAFEAEASAGAAAAAAAAAPAVVTPEAREEVAEKKKNLGLMSRLKQVLHLKDKSSGGDDDSNTVKVKTRHRSFQDLTDVKLVQTLVQHAGPVWTVAISNQGDFIATGGQDSIVRVWAVMGSTAARELDEKLRAQKAQQDAAAAAAASAGGSLHVHGNIEVTSVSGGVPPISPASAPDIGGHSPVELPNFEQEYKGARRNMSTPAAARCTQHRMHTDTRWMLLWFACIYF